MLLFGPPPRRAAAPGQPQRRAPTRRPQIHHEFERFSAYQPDVVVMVVYGGVNVAEQKAALKAKPPHIVVGTPGRIKAVRARAPRRPAAAPMPPPRSGVPFAPARADSPRAWLERSW